MVANINMMHQLDDGTNNYNHPIQHTLQTKDTLKYGKMLMAEDRRNFVQAMQTEVEGLKKILKVIRREDIPAGNKALP
ncbi:MAG: hypothetical protein ACK53Y_11390, partial [bacterium]